MSSSEGWEKVLWKKSPYPDNYIPRDGFLSSLRRNPNFHPYTYCSLVLSSCPVSQHLASVLLFLSVFIKLKERSLDPRSILAISFVCSVIGYIIWERLDCYSHPEELRTYRVKALKSAMLIFLALISLAPVLRTLTAATSSDSIWAIATVLFILNTLLADYSSPNIHNTMSVRLNSVLSMNAAMSSCTVLASRLLEDLAVFALITFSVLNFALFPLFRRRLSVLSPYVQTCFTVLLCGFGVGYMHTISMLVAWLWIGVFLTVTFVAPGMLIWAQRFKNEIRGPWDVAIPRVN